MRAIKYRAWNKEQRAMREWDISSMTNWLLYPETYELMQFTGLKDKNGKEIYEGDILKKHDEVKYIDHGFWCIEPNELGEDKHFWPYKQYREVVGNIYENPELLK